MIKIKSTNLVHERAFGGFNGLQLPLSTRTYLDGFASEFSDIDRRTKLYHFGYLSIRGVDFYKDLRENIDEKMVDPRYQDYENTARHAFASYLKELCRDNDSYYHKFFESLYHTLVGELQARYYKYEEYDIHEQCYAFR